MSEKTQLATSSQHLSEASGGDGEADRTVGSPQWSRLGLRRFSGVYVWLATIAIFSVIEPSRFFTTQTLRSVANGQAIAAILAMALVIPIAVGAFDLSIGANLGVSLVIFVWLVQGGMPVPLAILLTLLTGIAIGLANGFVVVYLGVDSFIAGLAMSSILAALALQITGGQLLVGGIPDGFKSIAQSNLFGVPLPVLIMLTVAGVLWFALEQTPFGRYLYAVGGNREAARLAGLPTGRITVTALVAGGLVASFAGVLLASRLGSASADAGGAYLLPVFSAVFLGSTQIFPGRVNIPGTLVAIYLLATGVAGLQISGAPNVITQLFNGLALILAVALAARGSRKRVRRRRTSVT